MDSEKLYDRPEVSQTYFFPQPGGPLPRTGDAGPASLSLADGTPIGGYWSHPLKGAPTMLYLHGNGECIADQLDHWPTWAAEAGLNIFFVDYPGYASSDGLPSLGTCCQAAMAGLDFLLQCPGEVVPSVVLAGRSVGSIFALHVAGAARSPRLKGLMLESAIADLKPRLEIRVPYEHFGIDRTAINQQLDRDFDHRAIISGLSYPALILHTRHDSLVPCWNSEHLARWAGRNLHELVLFDQGDHNTIQWLNEAAYRHALCSFVAASGVSPDGEDHPQGDPAR